MLTFRGIWDWNFNPLQDCLQTLAGFFPYHSSHYEISKLSLQWCTLVCQLKFIAAYPSDEDCYHIALNMIQLSVDLVTLTVESKGNGEIWSVSNGITDTFKDKDYLCKGENFLFVNINGQVQWLVSVYILLN